jgi:hypothetical protein
MASESKLRSIDVRLIEDLFEMGGGYVLDFSNKTFADFFLDINIDIDQQKYSADGGSKANRLRFVLKTSSKEQQVVVLLALWECREARRRRSGADETISGAELEFAALINRLGGKFQPTSTASSTKTANTESTNSFNQNLAAQLKTQLLKVSGLEPQPRGYAFEKFLKDLFDANGLSARASFRLIGEQIDGSFSLASETYLLEAKWQSLPVDASDLRAFNGKIDAKAAWSRGLFVSNSGFSDDGLTAFGTGKRVVCMDGLDIYEMLERSIPFAEVMARKVRRAAESGMPFIRVRDLNF